METKKNVAEILKNKPQGTKLYDWLHNLEVELDEVATTEIETVIWCTKKDEDYNLLFGYSRLATLRGWFDGLQILFPSKEMRDWRKFDWQKGDVLVSKDNVYIIFEKFEDDTYTRFKGKHYLWKECNEEDYNKEETKMLTSVFEKANDDAAQTYINTIEKRLGGKLNRETLLVEKPHSEFKDGDIAFADYGNRQDVFIVSDKTDLSEGYSSFISLDLNNLTLSMGCRTSFFKKDLCKLRLATEEEKQQLFDALAKEGKAWDAGKKMIIDLKQKVEFKPFDKVLVRNDKEDQWSANIFSYQVRDMYHCLGESYWRYCIPYIGNESLLGTTKDVEG